MAEMSGQSAAANKKAAVYEMQYYLKFIAKYVRGIKEITPDGIFGRETEEAVVEFQKIYALEPTGEINRATWNKITSVYAELKEKHGRAEPVYVYPTELSAMKMGDDYGEILVLQALLKRFSDRFENMPAASTSGIFDSETEALVRSLQAVFDLPQTGEVNKTTWNRIANLYSVFTFND